MASESIPHEAEGRMGYWLRAHSGGIIVKYKTTTGQTFKLWNSLDPVLKLKPTLTDFKTCLKKNLMLNFLETN